MRKRERFILSSILLAFGLFATQLVPVELRPFAILLFFVASYMLSAWALSASLNGIEWLTIVPMPALYALAVSLFYFLLPANVFYQFAIFIVFGIGMYALYLSANIFAVGKIKTIQLLRAAHAVDILFLLLITLFLSNFLFSLHLHPVWNGVLSALSLFLPILCTLWAIELHSRLSAKILWSSALFSLFLGELTFVMSLLPVGLWTSSLYLTAILYVGFGILQHYFLGRLFAKTLREYVLLAGFVTVSFLLLVNWK